MPLTVILYSLIWWVLTCLRELIMGIRWWVGYPAVSKIKVVATVWDTLKKIIFCLNNCKRKVKRKRAIMDGQQSGVYKNEKNDYRRQMIKQESDRSLGPMPWVETVLYLSSWTCSKGLGSAVHFWKLTTPTGSLRILSLRSPYSNSLPVLVELCFSNFETWTQGVTPWSFTTVFIFKSNVFYNKVQEQVFSNVSYNWQISWRSWRGCLGRFRKGALTCWW